MTDRAADQDLVAGARRGDNLAFEHLVRSYAGPVYRIALRILGSSAAAEDAAQEAFITAWRRLPEMRDDQAFAAWLYRIATNRSVNMARATRHDTALDTVTLPDARVSGPEQDALTAALLAALGRALGLLTPEQRACWVLRELEGMSYLEIAGITGVTPDAVRGRIHRARARLAEELVSWR